MTSKYITVAREFAKVALNSKESPIVIQNAHKAVEFALSAYASKKGTQLPRDHWQTENLSYKISRDFGKKFRRLLNMYLGAYRLEDGRRAEEAKKLRKEMLEELEKLVGETILSNE